MSLFDALTEDVLRNNPNLSVLRPVVEKEILHLDILRLMRTSGFLRALTFIGGTCLRTCYGASRLSEDLDFTGGTDFKKDDLSDMGMLIANGLRDRYDLPVDVSEPKKDIGNVQTWRIRLRTRPDRPDLPAQHISIDICAVNSFDKKPVLVRNLYTGDAGASGIILQAESLEEIFADKILALALRLNRIKNRDIWDIWWLNTLNIRFNRGLLLLKLEERKISISSFKEKLQERRDSLPLAHKAFLFEMRRFLPLQVLSTEAEDALWWQYVLGIIDSVVTQL